MNALFLYLAKAALLNAVLLGFYFLVIQPGRKTGLMRFVLLMTIILPFVIPVLPDLFRNNESETIPVYTIQMPGLAVVSNASATTSSTDWLPLLLKAGYLTVASVFLAGLLISVFMVMKKRRKASGVMSPFGKVLLEESSESPFSFFHWVFMSAITWQHPMRDILLRHEFSHVKLGHSFDRLLAGLLRTVLWFSPFSHLTAQTLSEVHEYQADARAISLSGDPSSYSNLIFSFATTSVKYPLLTNPFSYHIKKRMIMLHNLKPGKLSVARLLTGLVIVTAVFLFSSMVRPDKGTFLKDNFQNTPVTGKDTSAIKMEIIYENPEEKIDPALFDKSPIKPPSFPGGDDARITFFRNNLRYPTSAREKNIQGTVLYQVIIDKYGKVTEPAIKKGIGEGCDEEVLRVVKMMPDWNPGMANGDPVKVALVLPVDFKLSDNKKETSDNQKDVFYRVLDEKTDTKPDIQQDPKKKVENQSNEVFTVVENPPKFPGGEEARIAYMQKAITYPEQARKNGIEGTVYVTFVVEKDGRISNAKVLRGIGGGLDEIALDAIKNMPAWEPGTQRGKAVRVQFNIPVKFKLGGADKKK